MPETQIDLLEKQLNDFNLDVRLDALRILIGLLEKGKVEVSPEQLIANMHCHTFFSFNGYGYSPSAIAWIAKKKGIKIIGIVDFDVLDGVEEFLSACDILKIRASCGIETRVFIPEFSTREINSPGEPGISYHMGIGFTSSVVPSTSTGILNEMRERATRRNLLQIDRLNTYLKPISVDYETDILNLTPNGYATERHILAALINVVNRDSFSPAVYWSEKLNMPQADVVKLLTDIPKFGNIVRSKLMKKGGVGYIAPDAGSFPSIDEFHQLIVEANSLPCITWLDGTSPGEEKIEELAELLINKGAVAINIIPDRNWNISDPQVKQVKVKKLYQVVDLARKLDLPINMGTEMNSFGQKFVDDFDAPELQPVRQDFIDGAYFIYGHTIMERTVGKGYQSAWAKQYLPTRKARNEFFHRVGQLLEPGTENIDLLQKINFDNLTPDEFFSRF